MLYTKQENKRLVAYIAVNNPGRRNRLGNKLYQALVAKEEWAKERSWSAWRDHYKVHREKFDAYITKYQDKHNISRSPSPSRSQSPVTSKNSRNSFSLKEDEKLAAFLAEMTPSKMAQAGLGRSGTNIYREILLNLQKYPWARTHTWQSWRNRYVKNKTRFDKQISRLQEHNQIDPSVQLRVTETDGSEIDEDAYEIEQVDHLEAAKHKKPAALGAKRRRSEDDGDAGARSTDFDVMSPKKQKRTNLQHDGISPNDKWADSPTFSSRSVHHAPTHGEGPNGDGAVERNVVGDGEGGGTYQKHEGELSQSLQNDISQDVRTMLTRKEELEEVLDQWTEKDKTSSPIRPPFNVSDPSTGDADILYPTLPTPLSDTPRRLPGDYPESPSRDAETEDAPRNISALVIRSHPPTPPPTNAQSDVSILSLSTEPDTPTMSAVAKGKQRAEPYSTPMRMPFAPTDPHASGISNTSNPSQPTSGYPDSRPFLQSLDIPTAPHIPLFSPSPSPSPSDEPFATCSSTPRQTEVIHGIPKPRERSFRNNDMVRTRKVIIGQRDLHRGEESDEDQGKGAALGRPGEKKLGHESRVLSQPGLSSTTYVRSIPERMGPATYAVRPSASAHVAQRSVSEVVEPPARRASINTSGFVTTFKVSDSVGKDKSTPLQTAMDADVFTSTTIIPSGSSHDPYVLRTSHLPPEPGTSSTFSRTQTSTPVPGRSQRRQNRRRTFAGFGLRPGLPDIDLLAHLKDKRRRSHSPVVWTKGSPDITILPNPEPQRATSNLLSDTKRVFARRGPSRKSVIPVLVDSETGSTVPVSLDQFSPSTSGRVIQEGLEAIFKRMEMNHGFSAEVVRRTWVHQSMDLDATDQKLLRMRIAAEMVADSDEDKDPAQHSASNLVGTREHTQRVEGYAHVTQRSVPVTETDYTPPIRSRAGHYRRFTEQGRHWEARQREIELASRISANSSPSTATPIQPEDVPIWGEKENEILRTSSQNGLRELARTFGDKLLRQKTLALMMVDE